MTKKPPPPEIDQGRVEESEPPGAAMGRFTLLARRLVNVPRADYEKAERRFKESGKTARGSPARPDSKA
jgi:hypothetical protein